MQIRTRNCCVAAASLALAVVAFACNRTPAPAPSSSSGGTLRVATVADLAGVNGLIVPEVKFTREVLDQLFLHLVEEQADYRDHPPTFQPQLASSWDVSSDRRQVTFHLRSDAVWSDGVPVTADDIRFTWKAETAPEIEWAFVDSKSTIEDVEVVDPKTVRFHFKQPDPFALANANEGNILPKHVWEALPFAEWRGHGDWFRDHLVVSGPFRLEAWKPQEEIVLARNPRFFEKDRPRLERVVFRLIPDQAAELAELLAGSIDYVWGVTPQDAPKVESSSGTEILAVDYRQYDYICWNTLREPFGDPEIRRALTLSIDRQELVDTLWKGYATIAISPFLSTVWAADRSLKPWPHEPREARRIFAAKGFRPGADGILQRHGRRFAFDLTTNSGNQGRNDAMVLIQAQLKRVGVEARPRSLEIHALTERNQAHDFDATLSGWAIDTTMDIGFALHSREIAHGYNFGSYHNAELDRLIDESRKTFDPAVAKPIYAKMQALLHRDQPYTFLWEPKRLIGVSKRLRDATPNSMSAYFHLEDWWLAPPQAEAPGPK